MSEGPFSHDALHILWPSLELIGQYLQMLECKQSQIWQIFEYKGI